MKIKYFGFDKIICKHLNESLFDDTEDILDSDSVLDDYISTDLIIYNLPELNKRLLNDNYFKNQVLWYLKVILIVKIST